jgi:hypothetical protein
LQAILTRTINKDRTQQQGVGDGPEDIPDQSYHWIEGNYLFKRPTALSQVIRQPGKHKTAPDRHHNPESDG